MKAWLKGAIFLWALQLIGQDNTLVVRAYYPPGAEVRDASLWGLPLVLDTERGFLLLETDDAGVVDLERAGFQVIVDEGVPFASEDLNKDGGIPGYPCYPTNAEAFSRLNQLAVSYPDLVTLVDIGDSWEKSQGLGGADLMVAVLTNSALPGPKPSLFITSGLHARELSPTGLTMGFAESLLAGYGHTGDDTWLLDTMEVHLLVLANPDGRQQIPSISWRKNTDNDFCTGTNGRGVDLNRNYPFQWGITGSCSSTSPCSSTFRGPSAGSEPEIDAIQAYMRTIFSDQRGPNVDDPAPEDAQGVFLDLHSYAEQVLWPYGFDGTVAPNGTALTSLGRKFASFNGYSPEKASVSFDTCGTSDDFAYGDLGVAAFTFEMGTDFFEPCSNFDDVIWPDNSRALYYAAKVARAPYLWPSGPNTEELRASATTLVQGMPLWLDGLVRDDRFQAATHPTGVEPQQNITGAQLFFEPAWEGGVGQSMNSQDGSFDSVVEAVELSLSTSGISPGKHILLVQGTDASAATGAPSGLLVTVVNGAQHLALSGQVLELGSGTPLSARIEVGPEVAYSAAIDGSFYLAVDPGTYDLHVSLAGYNDVTLTGVSGSAGQALALPQILLIPQCALNLDLVSFVVESATDWTLVPGDNDDLIWDESPDEEYAAQKNAMLVSQPFRVNGGGSLDFNHRYRLDPFGADLALVEYRIDSGPWTTWSRFHGDGGQAWHQEHLRIPETALDQSLQMRFVMRSDAAFGHEGWQLGAMVLTTGGPCVLPLLYENWPNNGVTVLEIISYL